MNTQEYIVRDATALAELVASGEVTPSELLECAIEQIEKHNPARSVEQIEEILGRKVTSGDMDPDNELVTSLGQGVTATAYLTALESLHAFQREMAQWWAGGFDLLLTPTLTDTPPRVGDFTPDPKKPLDAFMRSGNLLRFTIPVNVTGQPAISLPLSRSATGLPVGVQLIADAAREDLLLHVAAQLEPEDGWPCPAP